MKTTATIEEMFMTEEILKHEILVELDRPVQGYWDGGAKSRFVFTPTRVDFTDGGPPGIRWGSWEANYWFNEDLGKSAKSHLAAIKRALSKGEPARTVTIQLRDQP